MVIRDDQFYISIKGVILLREKVLLLRKINGEWDLPGGRLSIEENPKQCLVREVFEETGLSVKPGKLLHCWMRKRSNKQDVFLVSHLCKLTGEPSGVKLSLEHEEAGWFPVKDAGALMVCKGIRKSVLRAIKPPGKITA